MSELGKHFYKNQTKETENQCQNAAIEQKTTIEKKNRLNKKTRPRVNYEWMGKTI